MNTRCSWLLSPLWFCSLATTLWAGGSGLNVAVVVNQSSSNSVELGNYYCEKRQVPPQNLLCASWPGGNVQWTLADFQSVILNPLISMLSARQLTNQIDFVVLSMDFPYSVTALPDGTNSTTAALFYGFKSDTNPPCSLAPGSTSLYAGSESIFRSIPPISGSSNSWLVMMITSSNLAQAKQIVDHGVASDSTFPTQTVYLGKSPDVDRNVRYALFDNAIYNTRLRGNYSMARIDSDSPNGLTNLLGYQNGLYQFSILPNAFVPGAMADSLTSFGGKLYVPNDHTVLLNFLNAGAAGSYGTVTEPCNYLAKFPSPQDYFYQARGFSLAECYYQSLTNPYQGLLVGEPLAAPFAQPASGSWSNLSANALLSGTTNLWLQFNASGLSRPVQQVDLFVDGTFVQTLTNIPPEPANVLYVTLNGHATNYSVPANATIESVVSNLTLRLHQAAYTNATRIRATAHGDRVELQSFDSAKAGSQVSLSVSNSAGGASGLKTFVAASGTNFLDTIAYGLQNFAVTGAVQSGNILQLSLTKTNGAAVSISVTNAPGNTNTTQFIKMLVAAVNTNASLMATDGLAAEDFISYDTELPPQPGAEFNLRARTFGWPASRIQAVLTGSANLNITPTGTQELDGNLSDLQPRAHLYVTAGVTNLPLAFAFGTATQPDGFHALTAVAYEGSHVRTQRRVAQAVRIQNTPLSAVFTTLVGDTNTALEATLQFSVVANTNGVTKIELFSTGGSLAVVTNQSSAVFAVAGTNLGAGLHPFYAVVTAGGGQQYRTETKWFRLIGAEPPFSVAITAPPAALAWPATAGRLYNVLSSTNLANPFQVRATVTPTNSAGRWTETNPIGPQQFYRIQPVP